MKRLFAIALFLSIFTSCFGQGNVVKVNLSSFVFKNIYISYERTFLKKFSVNIGVDMTPKRNIPFSSYFPEVNGNPSPAEDMKISGWRVTPEFRVYLSPIKSAPHGFYIAPYLRYSKYDFSLDDYQYSYTDIYDGNKPKIADVDYQGSYTALGGGIMIGHQWIIAKHLSLDLWIVGIGLSSTKFNVKASSEDLDKRYFEEGSTFTNEVKDALKVFNKIDIITGQDNVQAESKGFILGLRGLGFNVGLAF